jgi:hypothetical protein
MEANLLRIGWVAELEEVGSYVRAHAPLGITEATVHFRLMGSSSASSQDFELEFGNALGQCHIVVRGNSHDMSWYDQHASNFAAAAALRLSLPRPPNVISRFINSITFVFQGPKASLNLPVLSTHAQLRNWAVVSISKTALMLRSDNGALPYEATILNTGTVLVNTTMGFGKLRDMWIELYRFLENYILSQQPAAF